MSGAEDVAQEPCEPQGYQADVEAYEREAAPTPAFRHRPSLGPPLRTPVSELVDEDENMEEGDYSAGARAHGADSSLLTAVPSPVRTLSERQSPLPPRTQAAPAGCSPLRPAALGALRLTAASTPTRRRCGRRHTAAPH